MLPINLAEEWLPEGEEPRMWKERDTANPISGHYFVLQLTVNKGVEDGWRDSWREKGRAGRELVPPGVFETS